MNDNKLSLGLWKQTSKSGLTYWTGNAKGLIARLQELGDNQDFKLALFVVKEKKTERSPDLTLLVEPLSEQPREDRKSSPSPSRGSEIDEDERLPF